MTDYQEWPMWLPSDIHLAALSTSFWPHADEFWARIETQRQADAPTHVLTSREVSGAADEFIGRWGYDAARNFIQLILDGPGDGPDGHPFASLAVSLRCRFGRRGLIVFGGFLAAFIAGDEQWRWRCA